MLGNGVDAHVGGAGRRAAHEGVDSVREVRSLVEQGGFEIGRPRGGIELTQFRKHSRDMRRRGRGARNTGHAIVEPGGPNFLARSENRDGGTRVAKVDAKAVRGAVGANGDGCGRVRRRPLSRVVCAVARRDAHEHARQVFDGEIQRVRFRRADVGDEAAADECGRRVEGSRVLLGLDRRNGGDDVDETAVAVAVEHGE